MSDVLQKYESPTLEQHINWLKCAWTMVRELQAYQKKLKGVSQVECLQAEPIRNITNAIVKNLNWTITHNSDFPRLDPSERGIIIANHPTMTGVWPFANILLRQGIAQELAAVSKIENSRGLGNWFIGNAMSLGDDVIFINRSNHASAITALFKNAKRVIAPGKLGIIFPDQHRPKPKKVKEDIAKGKELLPWANLQDFQYTCIPRAGGIDTLMNALPEARIFNATVVEPWPPQSSGRFHMDINECNELRNCKDKRELQEALIPMWAEKNRMIQDFRSRS